MSRRKVGDFKAPFGLMIVICYISAKSFTWTLGGATVAILSSILGTRRIRNGNAEMKVETKAE